jgi:hypothetical protein
MTRDEVVFVARAFVGKPWRHQGRNDQGLDCVGLLVAVARILKVPHEDRVDYPRDPSNHNLLEHLRKFSVYVNPTSNLHGTIGIFRESMLPCHVGFFTEVNGVRTLIHSAAKRRLIVEEYFIPTKFKLVEVRAFPELVL